MADRPRIGVMLLQLGTPAAPTTPALRRYLAEFLWDRRVVDLARPLWWLILHGIVLRTRPGQSARLYAKVWTPAGSPLAVTSAAQAAKLEARLTALAGQPVKVVVGMRYGEPSIASALEQLMAAGVDRLLAFPMYPQYASATTGSSLERLFREIEHRRVVPSVRTVPPYFADPDYVDALVTTAREALAGISPAPDRLVLSFHGLPRRYAEEGDPYLDHCRTSAARFETALARPDLPVTVAFQSRFGREEWLQPYTDVTLGELGRTGQGVMVMCPGFTADCLETLEEIRLRGAEQFHHAGGTRYHVVPCLNEHPRWIDAMTSLAARELSGWM